jgi:hypothetical protein
MILLIIFIFIKLDFDDVEEEEEEEKPGKNVGEWWKHRSELRDGPKRNKHRNDDIL